jgi:excinuclease UvrABC ATPase subunit
VSGDTRGDRTVDRKTDFSQIRVKGARQHNLKGFDIAIPKRKIVVFSGVSGSGKSSLVFDTICAEAQRQLIDTFSSYARQRLPKISRPNVDEILDLSPTIVIDQKRLGRTLRSTVGTATEIFTNLRLLFSRCGEPSIGHSGMFSFNNPEGMCMRCKGLGQEMVIDENKILDRSLSIAEGAIIHPVFKQGGWFWKGLMHCGFFDPHKPVIKFSEQELHDLLHKEPTTFVNIHRGEEYNSRYEGIIVKLKRRFINMEDGADAYTRFFTYRQCRECAGSRINARAREVTVSGKTIPDLVHLEMEDLRTCLDSVEGPVAAPLVRRMRQSVDHLIDIGVSYLSLHRPVATLSGGESQRVKMAKQLDCDLVDLIYILDEPSIGLHPKDLSHLITMLKELRDKGNSILVVEHDREVMRSADHLIDIGPGAGMNGGSIVFTGSYPELLRSNSITGHYLTHTRGPTGARRIPKDWFRIRNATANNLRNIDVGIPKGVFTCITGVAGSGKSSLIHEEFLKMHPDSIVVDQTPVGRSSRSNPMTYVGAFNSIRKEFARSSGLEAGMFSFNSKGACPECKGAGFIRVEMSFLDDVTMTCEECGGKRYTEEVLSVTYQGKSIADVLGMTVNQALEFFTHRDILKKLEMLSAVGLDYLQLGQSLSTLSGGEAQRIKLASELHRKGNIYIMDEPTTGLHMADTEKLLSIITTLVDQGNSVIVIEHNLEVIRHADWIIDLGPEGGSKGGMVMATGTPEEIIASKYSITGLYLKGELQ